MHWIRIVTAIVVASLWAMPVAAQIYGQGKSAPGQPQDRQGERPGRNPSQGDQPQPRRDQLQDGLRAYTQRDYQGAYRLWAPLAQHGDGAAQYNLGRLYARGEGVQRDLPEAYKWFTIASGSGRGEGERAKKAIARSMSPAQMAEGLRRAEEWRQRRR